jgi:hypothetical protein
MKTTQVPHHRQTAVNYTFPITNLPAKRSCSYYTETVKGKKKERGGGGEEKQDNDIYIYTHTYTHILHRTILKSLALLLLTYFIQDTNSSQTQQLFK